MRYWSLTLSFVVVITTYAASPARPVHRADWSDVAGALGKSGSLQPGEVYKISFPRWRSAPGQRSSSHRMPR
jgi:hypothetical protein